MRPISSPCCGLTLFLTLSAADGFLLPSQSSSFTHFPNHKIPTYSLHQTPTTQNNKHETDNKSSTKQQQWEDLKKGYKEVITLEAFDPTRVGQLRTIEDFIAIAIHIPLIFQAFQTAITGQITDPESYTRCALLTALSGLAYAKMCIDEPRDWRAPRLAEYHSTYEFSALYLLNFSWLLWRVTPVYPTFLEGIPDIVACVGLSVVTFYGWAYCIYGKSLLRQVNDPNGTYQGKLQPSSPERQAQTELYLTGNILINILACLFVPFAWTIAIRGTEWWTRVQELHPNEAAFLGVSILVAILGDTSGTLLLRFQQLKITTSVRALVVMGIVSNIALLLAPEIVFNVIYHGGISEVGFYWE